MIFGKGYWPYNRVTTGSHAWYSLTTASWPRGLQRRVQGLFSTKATFRDDHGSPGCDGCA